MSAGLRFPVTRPALHDPTARDARYGQPLNVAQYLVDLHDSGAVFDFCGGIMFQLMLSDKLRGHLAEVAKGGGQHGSQPVVFDAGKDMLDKTPGYTQTANADNVRIFHGREVRDVANCAGGMGCVLHLSYAGEADPEEWTPAELKEYDGWGHDSQRTWREGKRMESEGWGAFQSKFGEAAFTLTHRFYLHMDGLNRVWLSAEDGCEGTPIAMGKL